MSNLPVDRSGTRLCLQSPVDLLAAVPYLLGFHPSESLVVIGLRGQVLAITARIDLPEPLPSGTDEHGHPPDPAARPASSPDLPGGQLGELGEQLGQHLAEVVARHAVTEVMLVGYGPDDRVAPATAAVRHAVLRRGTPIRDALRVDAGRYWSYVCPDRTCCPPEGVPYDLSVSAVPAEAIYAGLVALPDRSALVERLAPVSGIRRVAMRQATIRAEARLEVWARVRGDLVSGHRGLAREGARVITAALRRHRDRREPLTDDEVAWLSVLLALERVRDEAWSRLDATTRPAQLSLWTDVVTRADPAFLPAPASLLAFAAWQDGDGAMATVAVDRALECDPTYSMALLLKQVLVSGVPPSAWPFTGAAS